MALEYMAEKLLFLKNDSKEKDVEGCQKSLVTKKIIFLNFEPVTKSLFFMPKLRICYLLRLNKRVMPTIKATLSKESNPPIIIYLILVLFIIHLL